MCISMCFMNITVTTFVLSRIILLSFAIQDEGLADATIAVDFEGVTDLQGIPLESTCLFTTDHIQTTEYVNVITLQHFNNVIALRQHISDSGQSVFIILSPNYNLKTALNDEIMEQQYHLVVPERVMCLIDSETSLSESAIGTLSVLVTSNLDLENISYTTREIKTTDEILIASTYNNPQENQGTLKLQSTAVEQIDTYCWATLKLLQPKSVSESSLHTKTSKTAQELPTSGFCSILYYSMRSLASTYDEFSTYSQWLLPEDVVRTSIYARTQTSYVFHLDFFSNYFNLVFTNTIIGDDTSTENLNTDLKETSGVTLYSRKSSTIILGSTCHYVHLVSTVTSDQEKIKSKRITSWTPPSSPRTIKGLTKNTPDYTEVTKRVTGISKRSLETTGLKLPTTTVQDNQRTMTLIQTIWRQKTPYSITTPTEATKCVITDSIISKYFFPTLERTLILVTPTKAGTQLSSSSQVSTFDPVVRRATYDGLTNEVEKNLDTSSTQPKYISTTSPAFKKILGDTHTVAPTKAGTQFSSSIQVSTSDAMVHSAIHDGLTNEVEKNLETSSTQPKYISTTTPAFKKILGNTHSVTLLSRNIFSPKINLYRLKSTDPGASTTGGPTIVWRPHTTEIDEHLSWGTTTSGTDSSIIPVPSPWFVELPRRRIYLKKLRKKKPHIIWLS